MHEEMHNYQGLQSSTAHLMLELLRQHDSNIPFFTLSVICFFTLCT